MPSRRVEYVANKVARYSRPLGGERQTFTRTGKRKTHFISSNVMRLLARSNLCAASSRVSGSAFKPQLRTTAVRLRLPTTTNLPFRAMMPGTSRQLGNYVRHTFPPFSFWSEPIPFSLAIGFSFRLPMTIIHHHYTTSPAIPFRAIAGSIDIIHLTLIAGRRNSHCQNEGLCFQNRERFRCSLLEQDSRQTT